MAVCSSSHLLPSAFFLFFFSNSFLHTSLNGNILQADSRTQKETDQRSVTRVAVFWRLSTVAQTSTTPTQSVPFGITDHFLHKHKETQQNVSISTSS
ncbi:hypothetical protein DFJ77DRAFT_505356 [Powellomyces hirtus]|nr:hypothetical protein DFJ77DRAFT_505356 [Powellomyces hirtus]